MARTRVAAQRRPNINCNNRRVAAAKEIANAPESRRNCEHRLKSSFSCHKINVEGKKCGNVVR